MKLLDSFIHLFSGVFGNDKGPDVPSKNTSSSDEKGEENAVSADATEVGEESDEAEDVEEDVEEEKATEEAKENDNGGDDENDGDEAPAVSDKDEWMVRELEFESQPDFETLRSDEHLFSISLGFLLNNLTTIQKDELNSVCWVDGMRNNLPTQLTDKDEMWNFDLIHHLDYEGTDERLTQYDERQYSLVVDYEPKQPDLNECPSETSILLHVRGESNVEGSKYVRMSITIPPCFRFLPHSALPIKSQTWNLLFAADSVDPKEKLAEFNYLRQDAMDKVKAGRRNELSDVQNSMLFELSYDVAWHYFIAKDLMKKKNYALAISVFLDVYKRLKAKWLEESSTDKEDEIMFDCIYCLGSCYARLRLYPQSIYYLNMISANDNIPYIETFINSMVSSRDIRAMFVIESELKKMKAKYDKDGSLSQEDGDYVNFLRRRHGFMLIYKNKLDMAQSVFMQMLTEPANKEMALDALAFIQKMKKSKTPASVENNN